MDRWEAIARGICDQVRSGGLPVGSAIPSTQKLVGVHGVSRGTVRRAIDHLLAAGVLRGEPGRAVYVATVPPELPPVPLEPMDEIRQRLTAVEQRLDRLEQRG